jgi:hypothetical protein
VIQTLRHASRETDGLLRAGCLLICDRDAKWSRGVEEFLRTAGVRVVRTPISAPNCNAYAERFVRSVKEECLNRPARRMALAHGPSRVCDALPSGAEPSRARQRVDRSSARAPAVRSGSAPAATRERFVLLSIGRVALDLGRAVGQNGLDNALIDGALPVDGGQRIRRRQRLGGSSIFTVAWRDEAMSNSMASPH